MKATIVGPLGMGALAGIAGAAGAVGAGWPILACLAAYSLCGAAGLIGGAVANYRFTLSEEAREARPEAPAEPAVAARRLVG
ncbi:hypothetical protein P2H44_05010 [Albimonas sp. CAU 1670]|uniref:hypothetical protein n=1 Tax=Albimonas sp. CAU 1670 TaxID=3032599 RepID=UPI0023DB6ACD|nr:hypothetical protein [Albimonas sp. CAU 1670]MDF2231906.1 hypothetical protein [Albimonas sp. CAU 1670]